MSRVRVMLDSLFPIVVGWMLFLCFAIWRGAECPSSFDETLNLITFVLAQTFFLLASSLLLRRMIMNDLRDALTILLSLVFLSLFFLFGIGMAFQLWPTIREDPQKIFAPSVFFRCCLAAFAGLASWLLANTRVIYVKEVLSNDHA